MLSKLRVSTVMGVTSPPASRISRATVEIVDSGELGSGGNGWVREASETDFAATTTWDRQSTIHTEIWRDVVVTYLHSFPLLDQWRSVCQCLERHQQQGRLVL